MKSRFKNMQPDECRNAIILLLSRAFLRLDDRGYSSTSNPEACLEVPEDIDLNVPTGERSPTESDFTNETSRQGAPTPNRLSPQTPFDIERDAHG